jgi:hypothetical protein
MTTLFLRNVEQVALFEFELAGQLSDGHWENSSPHDHWKAWASCKVAVAPEGTKPGRNFWTKRDKYGLTSSKLLSVVGGRMLSQVRLTQGLGIDVARELEGRLGCDEDFKVMPIEAPPANLTSAYWAEWRAKLKKFDLGVVNTHILHGNYGKEDLLRDLREIAVAMRTNVNTPDLPEKPKTEEQKKQFFGPTELARAMSTVCGLKAEPRSNWPKDDWFTLKTATGMVVWNFQAIKRDDETWTIGDWSFFRDEQTLDKMLQLVA